MSYTELQARVNGVLPRIQEAFESREYYDDNLTKIFAKTEKSKRPDIPSALCKTIVDKSVSHLFPEGTRLNTTNEALRDTLKSILDSTRILERLQFIGTEGHITGTVALKSVWQEYTGWSLDVLCAEAIEIDHTPLDAHSIESVRIRFKYEAQNTRGQTETWWHQELWTAVDYLEWLPQRYFEGTVPDFTDKTLNTEVSGPHDYGEIPITVIAHQFQMDSPYGLSEITPQLKAYSRQLAISLGKVGLAGQLISTPAYKRVNDLNKQPINIHPGAIIDISGDERSPASLDPLQHPETPESVFKFQQDIKALAYEAAQVTNPDIEKEMRAGGTISSVAWKAFNYHFVKKIGRLRVNYGDNGVEAHVEKILRMGKRLNLPEYSLTLDKPESYEVELLYPPFFEQTAEEKMVELGLLKAADLPAEELGMRIAGLFGIERKELIEQIIENIEEERAALKPGILSLPQDEPPVKKPKAK